MKLARLALLTALTLGACSERFEVVVDDAGTYDYNCVPHVGLGMTGRIHVQ